MSRGQRVLQEINLIRAALGQQGNRLQKQAQQAVWVVHLGNGKSYRLTYQPAPISAWSLHPPDRAASRLLGLIDRALNNQCPRCNDRSSFGFVIAMMLKPTCEPCDD